MAETAGSKRARIYLRLDAEAKRKLERAAAHERTTLGRFVLASAMAAAERIVGGHERIVPSANDWDVFHDALLDPPEPNPALRRAVRRHRELIGE